MKQCNICNFSCKNNIGTYVGKNAKVLFLFESPTFQADVDGRILSGPVMGLFKQYLDKYNISLDDIAITYMVHCFPGTPQKDNFKLSNVPVLKKHYENCRHYLDNVLEEVKPKFVVTIGDRATKYFLGDTKVNLFDVYGAFVESPVYNVKTLCIMDMCTLYLKPQYRCYGDKSFEFIKHYLDHDDREMEGTNEIIATDKKLLTEALCSILTSTKTTVDIETDGLNFLTDNIMGIGFGLNRTRSYYIPLHKFEDGKVVKFWDDATENIIKEDLKKFFSNETLKIAYNGQFDFKFIRHYLDMKRINNASFDVMLASHLLNENLNGMRTLKLLSVLFTDMGGYESVLYNWLRKNKISKHEMYKAPVNVLGTYCCLDTLATYRLYDRFDVQLDREGLKHIFNTLTMPLQKVLMDVEYDGVQVDINHLAEIERNNKKALEDKLAVIRGKVGDPEFNVNSTQQLADLMFNKLGCQPGRITPSGNPATDKAIISKYAKKHSVLQDILDYKKIRTETSTFIEGMKVLLDKNNKVHTNYLLHGTDSGRLSSSNPNLQNILRDKNVKNLYIPEPGKVMIQCDLSQGEFNAWASYAQDEKMLNDIRNGLDIHRTVASKVWNMKPEDVTKELRTFAKRVVFGLMYGISIKGAANLVGCSENEAQKIQDIFFGMYPKAAAWLRNIPVQARAKGYLQTVFGRKRRLAHLFNHPLESMRSYGARVSSNFPMQSTVADITARNMINLKPYLDSVGAQIILTVHDSIIVQCDKAIAKQVSEEMMKIVTQPVPNYHGIIKCDIEIGSAWGHLDKVEFDDSLNAALPEEILDI